MEGTRICALSRDTHAVLHADINWRPGGSLSAGIGGQQGVLVENKAPHIKGTVSLLTAIRSNVRIRPVTCNCI